jgi:hypothetical protein
VKRYHYKQQLRECVQCHLVVLAHDAQVVQFGVDWLNQESIYGTHIRRVRIGSGSESLEMFLDSQVAGLR